ncbi:unnamed protein product [Orchesella dallaii]|uniref:Transposable element Hobo transposase n=1 Tax=Orchesella dallaii TaxID=48710 RepID=A0ABP1RUR1_9HEXA
MDKKMQVPTKDEMKDSEEDVDDDSAVVSKKWRKHNVYQLMKSYPNRVTFMEYESDQLRSEVWSKFKRVLIDKELVNFVKCNECIALFHWYAKLGTTSLLRHRCSGATQEASTSYQKLKSDCIDKEHSVITQPTQTTIPQSDVSSLNDSMVVGLVKDLQPIRTIESKGFLAICQQMVNFGAKHGSQDVTKFVKSKRVMKSIHMTKIAKSLRDDLKANITAICNYTRFTFTFDRWTNAEKQRDFLLLNCRFINSQFELQSSLMGVQEFPTDIINTNVNIREHCKKILEVYFAESVVEILMNDSIAVTDGTSNLKGVFPTRLPCMSHKLNMVLDNTLSEGNLLSHSEIKFALLTLKNVVTYFKTSGLNTKLTCSLKQSFANCWDSQVRMIESYVKSSCEVQAILTEDKEMDRISDLNEVVLIDLLNVIKPFKSAFEDFSVETNITVDKVVPMFFLLSKYLEITKDDSEIIKNLKLNMKEMFLKYYTLENIHIAATALNPRFL